VRADTVRLEYSFTHKSKGRHLKHFGRLVTLGCDQCSKVVNSRIFELLKYEATESSAVSERVSFC